MELVYTAYCDAMGLPLPQSRQQQYVGTKWLDIRRDLQAAVVARRRGQLTVREWARSVRGPTAHAIWSARDPLPFAVDLVAATSQGVLMLARRLSPGALRRARSAMPAMPEAVDAPAPRDAAEAIGAPP